jgi:hypothetical protein
MTTANQQPERDKQPLTAGHPAEFRYKEFEDSYFEYTKSLQLIWYESQKAAFEAGSVVERRLSEALGYPDSYQRIEDARAEYVRALEALRSDTHKRYREAYFKYVSATREAWVKMDPSQFDIWALITEGRAMQSAAILAANTLCSLSIIGQDIAG